MSSDNYDMILQSITTYDQAVNDNPFGIDLTQPNVIRTTDPYFTIPYNFTSYEFISGTAINDGNAFKLAFITSIMSNYKRVNDDIPSLGPLTIMDFAVKAVVCGTSFSGDGTCVLPAIANLPTEVERDHAWAIYKQLYLGEKKKINQMFLDAYALRNNCYNGYIGEEVPTTPTVSGFFYYPEFVSGGFADILLGSDVDDQLSMLELYFESRIIGIAGGDITNLFPWAGTEFSFLFADKEKRFQPIDNLYDSTVPEDVMVAETSAQVDAMQYEHSGRCALNYDVEYLLDALAQQGQFSSGISSISSNDMPQFTADLYVEMGGTIVEQGQQGAAVNVVTSNISGNLVITSNDATNANNSMSSITINQTSGVSWNQIVGMSMLYYVPGSLASSGTYQFEVLALVETSTDVFEERVLTGFTNISIGECAYAEICERPDNFGDNLGAIFAQLHSNGDFISPISVSSNTTLVDTIGYWYASSEVNTQLNDLNNVATISTQTNGNYTIILGSQTITFSFMGLFNPSTIQQVNGFVFDELSSTLTMYYLDANGSQNVDIVVGYTDNSVTTEFDLACGCDNSAEFDLFSNTMENAINDVITYYDPILDRFPRVMTLLIYRF